MTFNFFLDTPLDTSADMHVALNIAQQAPALLKSHLVRSPSSIAFESEGPGLWLVYEKIFLACLWTGDDKSAYECLTRLARRFGPSNERIMGLRGIYKEAIAGSHKTLAEVLSGYENVLQENPIHVSIAKRRIALLRSLSRPVDAIIALVEFLDAFPIDSEAWCELADLYQSQGMASQAIFSLEEALLVTPNAWNLHAKLGELQFISASSSDHANSLKLLTNSIKRFCRSVELCDDYLRGYYGLKMSTSRLLEIYPTKVINDKNNEDGLQPRDMLIRLQNLSTMKLQAIIKYRSLDRSLIKSENELIIAQEIVNEGLQSEAQ